MNNREYKVLTSNTPAFNNSAKLKKILAEEAHAGWDLEEVFDAYRIRLSRDRTARSDDANCKIDPYRINVGINSAVYMLLAAAGTIALIAATLYVATIAY